MEAPTGYNVPIDAYSITRIVLTAIGTPYMIIFTYLFFRYRKRYIIRNRFPELLYYYNILIIVHFVQGLFPYFPCYLYTISRWMTDTQGDDKQELSLKEKLFQGRYLGRIYAIIVVFCVIFYFALSSVAENFYLNRASYGIVHCNLGNWNWMLTAHIGIFGFIYLIVAFFFRKVQEELYIKREMKILGIIAIILASGTFVADFVFKDEFIISNFLAIFNAFPVLATFTVTTTLPVIYAIRFKHQDSDEEVELPYSGSPSSNLDDASGSKESFDEREIEFKMIFKDERLREAFRNYLMLEFCLENLLFLEEVDDLKLIENEDEMRRKANRIKNKFIGPKSRSPVNIAGVVVDQIVQDFNQEKISRNMFDTAREQVYNLLKVDPFPRFVIYRMS